MRFQRGAMLEVLRLPYIVTARAKGVPETAVTWRHMIALLENGQREDGTVALADVLVRWGAPELLRVDERA